MQLRFADRYEVRRMDRWNWAVYRVMPEGYETKARVLRCEDGRVLIHTGTYHGTPAAAVRVALRLLEDEAVECHDAESMCAALAAHEAEVARLADEIGGAVLKLEEAAR